MPNYCFTFGSVIVFFAVLQPLLLSYVFRGWIAFYDPFSIPFTFENIGDLNGKVVIVTGANTGIGKVTVIELARKGAHVIATTRDDRKGEIALQSILSDIGKDAKVEFMNLDLASLDSVRTFSRAILEKKLNLDILMLNAGVMMCPFSKTTEGYEMQFGTNHLGHFLLTRILLPNLISSKTRVVSVSSLGHRFSYSEGIDFNKLDNDSNYDAGKAYGQSKLANILFSNELARRYNGTGLTSNVLHPGIIKTELDRHLRVSAKDNTYFKFIVDLFQITTMSVEEGALTQLYVATSPALEGVTGRYFSPIMETSPSSQALNETLQKLLWEYSENATDAFFTL